MRRSTLLLVISLYAVPGSFAAPLRARHDVDAGTISIFRSGEDRPILTQNAGPDFRPYIHPIVAPDGRGLLTQYSPAYNPHQTGLYWGFTSVNGRDFFHHPGADYWRRISASVLRAESSDADPDVRWQTVYDLLNEDGEAMLRETQTWTMRDEGDAYVLELEWSGAAKTDITISEFDYGGMFLRMPWREGMNAQVLNSIRQRGERAEGQRAVWLNVGMQVEGRDDLAHIAIFDHPANPGFPQPWRVDGALGVGPVRARLGDWTIDAGGTAAVRHQLRVYTGELNAVALTSSWSSYVAPRRGISYAEWDRAELDQYAAWHLADMASVQEAYRAESLTPEKAAATMTLPDDFEVNVFASEPMITQPMAFCWDDRGRLWIAQNREYNGIGGGIELSGESRILILEDTDRDGVAEKRTVFLEEIAFPSAIAVGFDGLWLGAVPNLLFVPDRDGDDRADVEDIEVRLTGWGREDLHEILNSFCWGPDGWLYGLQGVFTPSRVGKPAGRSRVYRYGAPYEGGSEVSFVLAHPEEDSPFDSVAAAFAAGGNCQAEPGPPEGAPVCFKLPMDVSAGDKVTVTAFDADGAEFDLSTLKLVEFGFGKGGQVIDTSNLDTSSGKGVFTITRAMLDSDRFDFFALVPPRDDFQYDGEATEINGGVWRYHPIKDRFEVVAHGFSNPWGIDYDAKGQLFLSACVIPHLWHVVPGGIYHRQSGSHFNPHVYNDIRTIGDHRHRSAHGGARVYLSDAFPETYRGRLFMGNIHEHAVLTDILERRGSGFVGRHGDDFLLANNAQFVGFSTEIGPDGAVYILDWHDAEICGGAVRSRDTGRVYRILPTESRAKNWEGRYADLRSVNDAELVKLQLRGSAWHARRARVILQNRAAKGRVDQDTHAALREIFRTHTNADHRLRALWALHVTGGIDPAGLLEALRDRDEYVRSWAIQLLCEDMSPPKAARDLFRKMAEEDRSPVVRLYLASALQRMRPEFRWTIARELVAHGEDADDHNIPKIIWFGIEPGVAENPEQALEIARRSRIPMLTRHIARRLTTADHLAGLVEEIGHNRDSRSLLLEGLRDGLEGIYDVKAPQNWARVYREIRSHDKSAAIALELGLKFGDALAANELLKTLQDAESSLEDRRQALRGLARLRRPELEPQLPALLDDDALRRDAIRATASFDDDSLAKALLDRYSTLSSEDKLEAVHALASRSSYGSQLTGAIERGDVPRRDVPSYLARVLLRSVGNRFLEVWGPVKGLSPESEATIAKYRFLLSDEALAKGDPRRGREVFEQTCSACHQVRGDGGRVGPDLTGANLGDLNYLLGNIVTPSAVVNDDYRMTLVLTDDGQVYSGVVENESERQLRLRVANVEEPVTIAVSRVVDRELTEQSMMPEGLLDRLADAEVIHLFSYLRSVASVSTASSPAAEREFELDKKYLNLPVLNEAPECRLSLEVDGRKVREFVVHLAPGKPDYWLYLEVGEFAGKTGTLSARKISSSQMKGFEAVHHADTFPGEDQLYKEELRPQFHFSSKRGWNNDPNGLVYYRGEYHLFYQHNPFGWNWNNMTWGHAISTDLVHWTEMGDALHQDEWGMMFSGSGVVDWKNTTGFQTGDEPPLVLIYTSAGGDNEWSKGKPFTQGLAYSNDRGRTWTKYAGNPVQGHLRKANRDPKVVWWEPTNEWVIVMYLRDSRVAFFRSPDLKRWELQSVLPAFHECPELFQLSVDGNEKKKWILNGAHGEYFIGDFDGTDFTPETQRIRYNYGNCFYASQTFSDIPKDDGRRIQIAWGRVNLPDMPFNQMMTFPVSLTLRSTDDGLRVFAYPVKEIEEIHGEEHRWENQTLEPGENPLNDLQGNLFDIAAEIALGDADEVGFEINGFPVSYDVRERYLSAGGNALSEEDEEFGEKPGGALAPVNGKIRLRILVDRPSVEIFANDGRVYMPMQAVRDLGDKSLKIYAKGGSALIEELAVREIEPTWPRTVSAGAGETLYNGIVLPDEWPPEYGKLTRDPMPVPYLENPPAVIPIDVGRQLFVDDFLIEKTTLERTFHQPEYYSQNPVINPGKHGKKRYGLYAAPFSGGAWYDPADKLFKLWYTAVQPHSTRYARSKDGLHWEKPELDSRRGTNIVLEPRSFNSSTVWLDHNAENPEERFKYFASENHHVVNDEPAWNYSYRTSADGIHWSRPKAQSRVWGDRSTAFYNPFREVWVCSQRTEDSAGRRSRSYVEGRTASGMIAEVRYNELDEVSGRSVHWVGADDLDPRHTDPRFEEHAPQLYNVDAAPYESLMIGQFSIWQGPENDECGELNLQKRNDILLGFSRDGFHWDRPNRERFISCTWDKKSWRYGNVQSVAGGCLVVRDKLYFYFSGHAKPRDGDEWDKDAATGLAILRRDGFASMDAGDKKATLTTRPVTFQGKHLFVNVDCPEGELRVELLRKDGQRIEPFTVENCEPISSDNTLVEVRWQRSEDLAQLAREPVRFRFHLRNGSLYAFWVSADKSGASHGYVGAGGPGFTGATDTVGVKAYE